MVSTMFARRALLAWVGAAVLAIAVLVRGDGASAEDGRYLTGQLLVAAEDMPDPRFAETVIYLVRHDENGAFGLVINRVLGEGDVAEMLEGFGIDPGDAKGRIPIYYGGPVQSRHGFILHTADYARETTEAVDDKVALTVDIEALRDISRGRGPRHSLFAFGYAGWAAGQLEQELARHDWYVVPADEDLLFDEDLDTKWERALARRGIDL